MGLGVSRAVLVAETRMVEVATSLDRPVRERRPDKDDGVLP